MNVISIRNRMGRSPWALIDQAMISAANFATMIVLARGMDRNAFGLFTLIYSILLFANSLQSCLVIQPHNVLGSIRDSDYVQYTTSTALLQLAMAFIAAVIAGLAAGVGYVLDSSATPLLMLMGPAIAAWQLQEFTRRVLYTEGRLSSAFANDAISYGGQGLGIFALAAAGTLTGPRALGVLALTSALAALLGVWQIRSSLSWRPDFSAFRENWEFGRWLVGGEIVGNWLTSEMLVYIASSLLGVSAAGILRAVNTVFGPARTLTYAVESTLPIRLARLANTGGRRAIWGGLASAYLLAAPPLIGFCLIVSFAAEPILHLLYGHKYDEFPVTLILFSIASALNYMGVIAMAGLKAGRRSRRIFSIRMVTAVVVLPFGYAAIRIIGLNGAVIGMIASNGMTCLLMLMACRESVENPIAIMPSDTPTQAPALIEVIG